jgi:phosphoribosyl-ATP pyrophosphohydrolase
VAKKRKAKKGLKNKRPKSDGRAGEHVLDQLYVTIASRKGGDPDTSYAARLFSRGRQQIAKKLGEEAVEALIEGIRGDRPKLVAESADVLYHLLTLWAATSIKPKAVWAELARREGLSGKAAKADRNNSLPAQLSQPTLRP